MCAGRGGGGALVAAWLGPTYWPSGDVSICVFVKPHTHSAHQRRLTCWRVPAWDARCALVPDRSTMARAGGSRALRLSGARTLVSSWLERSAACSIGELLARCPLCAVQGLSSGASALMRHRASLTSAPPVQAQERPRAILSRLRTADRTAAYPAPGTAIALSRCPAHQVPRTVILSASGVLSSCLWLCFDETASTAEKGRTS